MESVVPVTPVGHVFSLEVPERNRLWYEEWGYEPYSAALFSQSAAVSDVVVDIGAHVGFYSLLARSSNPAARVVAVEASPDNVAVLSRNMANAGGERPIKVLHAAFSSHVGEATFQITEASDNCSLTGHPNSPTIDTFVVPMICGDQLEIEAGKRITVKIDVEGNELDALEGMRSVFSAASDVRLLVEFNPKCLVAAGTEPQAVVGWLRDNGFRLFAVDDALRSWSELKDLTAWERLPQLDGLPSGYLNLYCLDARRTLTVSGVLHSSGTAGAESTHAELSRDLVRRGFMVHTVVPTPDHGIVRRLRDAGSSVSEVPPFAWWMHPAPAGDEPIPSLLPRLVSSSIVEEIRRVDADVVLTQTGAFAQGATAAAAAAKPHVWFLHEFGDKDQALQLPVPRADFGALVSSLSTRVLANSRAVADYFFGGDPGRVRVAHPIPQIAPVSGQLPPETTRWRLGVVGTLAPGKGQDCAVQAVALLRETGHDVALVLVGEPAIGPFFGELKELVARLRLGDRVTFAGAVANRQQMYSLMNAVAVPSHSEAFGRVPFEATAFGRPVLYATAGGMTEYLTPGETGLGFPPGDAEALAAAVRQLLDDPSLGERLVTQARSVLLDPKRREAYVDTVVTALRDAGAAPVSPVAKVVGALTTLGAQNEALGAQNEALEAQNEALEAQNEALAAASARVHVELASLQDQAADWTLLEMTLRDEIERRGSALSSARAREATLSAEVDRAQNRGTELAMAVGRIEAQSLRLASDFDEARSRAFAAETAAAVLRQELGAVRDTVSWHVTLPLRFVRALPRRIRQARAGSMSTLAELGENVDVDVDYYRVVNDDLQHLTDDALRRHYVNHGRSEGRRPRSVLGTSRTVTRSLNPKRDTVFVVFHEATRTGAPLLGWNLLRELGKDRNVVAVLLAGGELTADIESVASATVTLDASSPWSAREMDHVVGELAARYSPAYAIANSAATHQLASALERSGIPVVGLVHEFASSMRPVGVLAAFHATASELVFPAEIVADSMRREYADLLARNYRVIAQGQLLLPPGPNLAVAQRATPRGPDGVERDLSERSLAAFLADLDAATVLVVGAGTVAPRKGVEFFLQAASQSGRMAPDTPIAFAWIGDRIDAFQWYVDELHEQVVRSGIQERVTFLGAVSDLGPLFERSDIFFLSSRLDPFPNVTIDAALAGVPVVAFNGASGFAEWLIADDTLRDLVVPHLDATAAAATIVTLAEDAAARDSFGASLSSAARGSFDIARYASTLDELGRSARVGLERAAEDIATIDASGLFSTELYASAGTGTNSITLISEYVHRSRLTVPRARPRTGLIVRRPTEGFHPLVYAEQAPGYDDLRDGDPFADFIRRGEPYGPWVHQIIRPGAQVGEATEPASVRVLVHGHFHYPELADEALSRIALNQHPVDILLTTTSSGKAHHLEKSLEESGFSEWRVEVVPNHGRNLAPLFTGVGMDGVKNYDLLLHVHGKKSPHVDARVADRWRDFLWENLIGGHAPMLDTVCDAFARQPTLGLVSPEDPHLNDWDLNRDIATDLAKRLGISTPLTNHFDFPLGAMFWARTDAIRSLFEARLTWEEYPVEPLPIDGTMLHALERLLPFAASDRGYTYAKTVVPGIKR